MTKAKNFWCFDKKEFYAQCSETGRSFSTLKLYLTVLLLSQRMHVF